MREGEREQDWDIVYSLKKKMASKRKKEREK